ncbi:MAG: hypothetical protein ACR5K7_06025 [Symbiopectobacterium sp.]
MRSIRAALAHNSAIFRLFRHFQVISSALSKHVVLGCEVTLLYGSKDPQRNHAQVLRNFLLAQRNVNA